MHKFKSLFHWLLVTITGVYVFIIFAMQVQAGVITGGEANFTHKHTTGCIETVTLSCENSHSSRHVCEYGSYNCKNCNATTNHYIVADNYSCSRTGLSWQKNGYIGCNACGTRHSEWSNAMPGNHSYTEQRQSCGLQEGEKIGSVYIEADNTWTNSGVNLTAKCNLLKQDSTFGAIGFDWAGGNKYVTENGTYMVTATNKAGQTVSASVQINCIDKISPVINVVNGDTSGMTGEKILVSVNAGDNESGLADAAFSTDGGASWTGSSSFWVEEGKEVSLAVRDKAGNISSKTVKRSDFPYPAKPVPTPAPTPAPTPTPGDPSMQEGEGKLAPADTVKPQQPSEQGEKVKTAPPAESNTKQTVSGSEKGKQEDDRDKNGTFGKKADAQNLPPSRKKAETIQVFRMEKASAGEENKDFTEDFDEGMQEEVTAISEQAADFGHLQKIADYIIRNAGMILGGVCVSGALLLLFRLIWLHSVILYCYNGGDEYKKLGLLHLKREKYGYELYLPEYLLESAGTPRYRLMVKNRLVKKNGKKDIVLRSDEHKLRQPIEECIDFVL